MGVAIWRERVATRFEDDSDADRIGGPVADLGAGAGYMGRDLDRGLR